jgi:hypothetical protein
MSGIDSAAALAGLALLRAELSILLRAEEIRLLRRKEALLVVLQGHSETGRVQRRAVDLSLLHTRSALTEELQTLAAAVS